MDEEGPFTELIHYEMNENVINPFYNSKHLDFSHLFHLYSVIGVFNELTQGFQDHQQQFMVIDSMDTVYTKVNAQVDRLPIRYLVK